MNGTRSAPVWRSRCPGELVLRRRSVLALFPVVPLLVLGACGTQPSADVADAAFATDSALDAPGDAQDATVFDVADTPAIDGLDVADTALDVFGDADASPDAPTVSFQAMTHITSQSQNCQPFVAPDPMTLAGSVDLDNFGAVAIGPITASEGIFVRTDGSELARFTFPLITIPAIAPGTSGHAGFTKNTGSLVPASGCSAVPCGSVVRLAIPIAGTNVPTGTRATSMISTIGCVY